MRRDSFSRRDYRIEDGSLDSYFSCAQTVQSSSKTRRCKICEGKSSMHFSTAAAWPPPEYIERRLPEATMTPFSVIGAGDTNLIFFPSTTQSSLNIYFRSYVGTMANDILSSYVTTVQAMRLFLGLGNWKHRGCQDCQLWAPPNSAVKGRDNRCVVRKCYLLRAFTGLKNVFFHIL